MATINRLPSGSWRAQIRRSGHRPITKTFEKKADATAWARTLEGSSDALDAFPDAEARRRTLKDAIDEFILTEGRGDLTQLHWWQEEFGHLTLATLTPSRIREGLRKLAREPARRGHGRGKSRGKTKALDHPKSASTVNRFHASIGAFCRWAVEQEWLTRNPARGIRRHAESQRVRWLTDEERGRLLKAVDASEWEDLGLLVRLALSTGARLGELLSLRWEDLDLPAGYAYLRTSKNKDARAMPLIDVVKKRLEAKARPIKGGLLFPSPEKPDRPFVGFRDYWNEARDAAGLVDFKFHDLRHSAASYLAMSGCSLLEIGHVLGHRSAAATARYAHLSTEHKEQLVKRVLADKV